jgi:excisionase family DNA binding protein
MEIILQGIKLNELVEKVALAVHSKLAQDQPNVNAKDNSHLLSRKDVAELLKITLPTLHDWTKRGWLKAYRIGSRVLYDAEEIRSALNRFEIAKHKKLTPAS